MKSKIEWIPVEVNDGMFTDEYAVSIKLFDGEIVSIFADKSIIQEEGGVIV